MLARELLRALGFVSAPEVLQVQGVGQTMGTPHLHQKLLLLSGICQTKPSIIGWKKKQKCATKRSYQSLLTLLVNCSLLIQFKGFISLEIFAYLQPERGSIDLPVKSAYEGTQDKQFQSICKTKGL